MKLFSIKYTGIDYKREVFAEGGGGVQFYILF
jgi:hypothetical protein